MPVDGGSVVLMRCDATSAGGVGHLARCMALVGELTNQGASPVHLSARVETPLGRELLAHHDVRLHPAEPETDGLLALAARIAARVVHVDCYDGFDDLRESGAKHGILTSTATDEKFGRRDADVIVDGSPRAETVFDDLYANASVGLGPAYLALRREFSNRPRRAVADEPLLSVLVVMGGTDPGGYSVPLAGSISRMQSVAKVGVVGGESSALDGGAEGRIVSVARRADFAAMVEEWDFVVTAAGTTVWELAALGLPMAVLGVAENQRDYYDTVVDHGMAVPLGFMPDLAAVDLHSLAQSLSSHASRVKISAAARHLVDGRGAERVVRLWDDELEASATGASAVRPATYCDAGRLFAWRNDSVSRAASRSTAPLGWPDHLAWLGASLDRPDRKLFIGLADGRPVGIVRFDRRPNDDWEISITVAPHARGRGHAKSMVEDAAAVMQAHVPVGRITAELRVSNHASRALFEGLGYRKTAADGAWERWQSEPRFRRDPRSAEFPAWPRE